MDKAQILDALSSIDSAAYYEGLDVSEITGLLEELITKLRDDIDEDRQAITLDWLKEIGFVVDEKWPNIVSYYVSGGLELFFSLTQQTIALQEGFFQNGEARFVHLPMIKTYEQLNTLLLLLTSQQ